jgi:hypothetical protein
MQFFRSGKNIEHHEYCPVGQWKIHQRDEKLQQRFLYFL